VKFLIVIEVNVKVLRRAVW